MVSCVRLAAVSLNLTALDFAWNYDKILQSIVQSKKEGACYRFGPELEIPGYCCYDAFHETDTDLHSLEVLSKLLSHETCQDIIVDVGMPVMHRNVRYNCRVVFYNKNIVLIRPKMHLANFNNYREHRYFTSWNKPGVVEEHILPSLISDINGQETCIFGDAVIDTLDTCIGIESCEELWSSASRHIALAFAGAEIFVNGSASHFKLGKSQDRALLVNSATFKCGGVYGFTNLNGCDGERLYFAGDTLWSKNGEIFAYNDIFSIDDVQVTIGEFDLASVRAYRCQLPLYGPMNSESCNFPRVKIQISICKNSCNPLHKTCEYTQSTHVEEISKSTALWLWDYLRKSGMSGYFLPLSGGMDSSSVACIVAFMCKILFVAIEEGNEDVLSDVRRVVKDNSFMPTSYQQITNKILSTCYMASRHSSQDTKLRAINLSKQIGADHSSLLIDTIVDAAVGVFESLTGKAIKFKMSGGGDTEDLALQNIQARVRMLLSYLMAQLLRYSKGADGSLLVLGSSNVDESLRGYMTKYDCSSADVNPIGGISKTHLKLFLEYAMVQLNLPSLKSVINAVPSAELRPVSENAVQSDEEEMGMTYDELSTYGILRKVHKCGPYSMFCNLLFMWKNLHTPEVIAKKVKHFFTFYAINRHKMTVLTPSVFIQSYSPDDNRFDLRQIVYNYHWPWQFQAIDRHLQQLQN